MINKFIFVVVCALTVLVGCSDKEVGTALPAVGGVVFSRPVVEQQQSRAVGEIATYPKSERFIVSALATKGDYAAWNDSNAILYMDNVEVMYDTALNGWASATPYYWPYDYKLTFSAFSPARLPDAKYTDAVDYDQQGLRITNFKVPPKGYQLSTSADKTEDQITDPALKMDHQFDLLYSERAYNKVSANSHTGQTSPQYNGVDLRFHHALTSVRFTIKVEASVSEIYKLVDVRLNNIANVGSFAENITSDNPYTAAPEWTLAEMHTTSFDAFDQPNKNIGTADAPVWEPVPLQLEPGKVIPLPRLKDAVKSAPAYHDEEVWGKGRDFIMLPQTFINEAPNLELTFLMSTPADRTRFITQKHRVSFMDITPEATWKMGYRYTYNIVIDPQKISFTATLDKWGAVPGGDI